MTAAHFNRLTPAQAEILALLAEECGEVVQSIGKILRHGLSSTNPNDDPDDRQTNREQLEHELGDVQAAILIAIQNDLVDDAAIDRRTTEKIERVRQYLHHVVVPR